MKKHRNLLCLAVLLTILFFVGSSRIVLGQGRTGREPAPQPKKTNTKKTPAKKTTPATPQPIPPVRPQPTPPQIEMMLIPAGTFSMGSPDGAGSTDEHPQHRVSVQSFYMGKYEVTKEQYVAVMGTLQGPANWTCDQCPIEWMGWEYAEEFIRRLNAMQSRYKYRLPSEAEWEYACRAGTSGDYAGDLGSMAWYEATSADSNKQHLPHPVGLKQANAFGLFDMHGNVGEICEDWYHDHYDGAPADGSAWINVGGEYRVQRGGSAMDSVSSVRSASRNVAPITSGWGNVGFRLAASRQ